MKKIIKLKESDIENIVKRILKEQASMFGTAGLGMDSALSPKKTPAPQTKVDINPKKLKVGDGGKFKPKQIDDVKALQQKLMDLKLLKTDTMVPTGYFGSLTQKALDAYNASGSVVTSKEKVDPKDKGNTKTPATSKAAKKAAKCETGTEKVLQPAASLVFDGDKLSWFADGKVIKSWNAVSGLTWKNASPNEWGKMLNKYTQNRQEWSKQINAGPLPEGQYNVGPLETRSGQPEEISAFEAFWYKLTNQFEDPTEDNKSFCKNTIISRVAWGNYRLRITPTGGQDMYSRGSFYLHGGSLRGSHGCIDLTDDMEDFAKFFGVWSSANKQKTMPMIVKYKNPLLNQVIQKLVNL